MPLFRIWDRSFPFAARPLHLQKKPSSGRWRYAPMRPRLQYKAFSLGQMSGIPVCDTGWHGISFGALQTNITPTSQTFVQAHEAEDSLRHTMITITDPMPAERSAGLPPAGASAQGKKMSGQIFISYRREESRWSARSLHYRLSRDFDSRQIFMDIDNITLGADFVQVIEAMVAKCDVLIAVIGNNWLTTKDDYGDRRLDNPQDFVRMEIATALKREIRVIPVLLDGARMPRPVDLPDDLKPLVRRNALRITDTSFEGDCQRLAGTIRRVLENAAMPTPTPAPSSTPAPAPGATASSNPVFYKTRGWEFHQGKDYDKAISDYNEAIRLDPESAAAYYNRSLSYYEKRNYDKAISDYAEAIRLDSTYAVAYNNRRRPISTKRNTSVNTGPQ